MINLIIDKTRLYKKTIGFKGRIFGRYLKRIRNKKSKL
jgi:hypothetical protein